jgi:metallophosphoesterase superfamily enzyme
MILIRGNHDIIHDNHYLQLDIRLHHELQIGPFLMLHHPQTDEALKQANAYVFCGHIHPGVNMVGRGRQSITLPCFAFGPRQVILPSFGRFTGRVALKHNREDHVFAVLKDKVIAVD